MANHEHLRLIEQGIDAWNQWREENLDVRPDLSRANLGLADLSGANLSEADLDWANLSGTNLSGANLSVANLFKADLFLADLSGANLSEANLSVANLLEANLSEADLSGARASLTLFANLDLSVVKGLETIVHDGPSIIGIDTIFRSGGEIPEAFLRGAGVPYTFIAHVDSLTFESIQFYSCFISYSHRDEDFAQQLYDDLQDNAVRCWFAPEDMKIGDKIRPRITQSIRQHDKLLVVLSEHSIESDWVEDEVETALEEERKWGKTVLFPIRLDEAVMETDEAWAAKIRRTRHIGDFGRWKEHDSYHQGLGRLLRDLKAG